MPAVARQHTEDGAKAFARHYLVIADVSWVKADPTLLTGLAMPTCKSCAGIYERAVELRSKRHHNREPSVSLGTPTTKTYQPNAVYIAVPVAQRSVDVLDGTGRVVETPATKDSKWTAVLSLVWSGGGWKVETMQKGPER